MENRLARVLLVATVGLAAPLAALAQDGGAPQPKPDPTYLERLSPDWPEWLNVAAQYRGRVESVRPVTGNVTSSDGYYLNRLRLSVGASLGPWMRVFTQIHDTEAMGYATSPAPKTMAGGFDLRLGYLEVGRRGKRGVVVTGGRSELTLGDGRLIASSDWGNASRTYDLGRVSAFLPGLKVDVFRAAPVDIDPSRFDRARPGEHFWGGYATLDKLKGVSLVDFYVVAKMNSVVAGELGSKGDGRVYTCGGRLAGTFAKTWTYNGELALQRGHLAADDLSAWATHVSLAYAVGRSAMKPRVAVEYDFASGDANPKDGAKGTFDQLYASNHAKYGLADLVGWRNMQAIEAKFDVSPTKKLKVNAALNKLYLANAKDAWYGSSGSKIVANTAATSRDVGWEPDLYASYAVSKELSFGAGLAVLLPGGYVKQSTKLGRYWYPYATWALKL